MKFSENRITFQHDRQFTHVRNTKALSYNHCCCGKAMSMTCFECVCSLSYPACKAHAPYYSHLWPVWLNHVSSTLSHKWHDFRREAIEYKMCVLIFYTTFICNISNFRRNSARYCYKCAYVFTGGTRHSCRILMKLGTLLKDF
jgi:hypothetical protein